MIGSSNLAQLCQNGLKSLENPVIPNIHPRISGKVYGIFSRIDRTQLYPMSEIEMDKNLILRLEHSAKTPEEKELLKKASLAVYLAERNAQARELKRAKNGEPPEEVDSEEDEDYWKCGEQRELTAEENQYLLSNRHTKIHPRILGRANSIFARLYRKPDISLTEVKRHELGLQGLRGSCKTPEEEELVSRAAHAVWEARQYAHQRALVRAKHPKGQDEEEKEFLDADAQEDNWTVVQPFEVEPQTQAQEEASFVDNWGHAESVVEIQGEDCFLDNWAQAEPFGVDNWTAHEVYLKEQRIIPDLERKLLDSEDRALDLAEELRASKEREEQMKKDMEEMKRSLTKKCDYLETELDETLKVLRKATYMSVELIVENQVATETLKKSQEEEVELQETVTDLKAQLIRYKEALRAQALYNLARENRKCHSITENQEN